MTAVSAKILFFLFSFKIFYFWSSYFYFWSPDRPRTIRAEALEILWNLTSTFSYPSLLVDWGSQSSVAGWRNWVVNLMTDRIDNWYYFIKVYPGSRTKSFAGIYTDEHFMVLFLIWILTLLFFQFNCLYGG
jgi:hypothetical protein